MAKRLKQQHNRCSIPRLPTGNATRSETDYLGVLRLNDPLLLEKGQHIELYRDLKRDGKVFSTLQKRDRRPGRPRE